VWPRNHTASSALLLIGFVLPAALFTLLAHRVAEGRPLAWDQSIERGLGSYYDHPQLVELARGFVTVGMAIGVVVFLATSVALLRRTKSTALFWVLSVGGAAILSPLLKDVFQRPSIGHTAGYSFPSGNAMVSMAAAAAVLVLVTSSRRRALGALVLAPVVGAYGAALVLLYWHYPSDVVAGWCFGVAWVTALRLAFRDRLTPRRAAAEPLVQR
jgi:undecaprenyl-diphosphatase